MNGHRYTDATGFRYGTLAIDVSGHATTFQLLPGYKRFLYGRLPAMIAPFMVLGALTGHGVAVALVSIGLLALALPTADGARRARKFRRDVVEPLGAGVSAVTKSKRVVGKGHTWIDVPGNFRDAEDASIKINLPPEWVGDPGDKARLVALVASKLNLDELTPSWSLHGAVPSVSFSVPPKPPATVSFDEATRDAEATADEAPMIGYGPRRKVELFSLLLESPHALINGGSGAGKSVLLAWLVAQFMRRGFGVLVLDAKFVSHMWLRRIPGVLYASEDAELHEALVWLDMELVRRARMVSRAADTDAASAGLVPLVAVLEELTTAANRLRAYWKSIKGPEDPMMSPALTALANLANMGREMRVHILMAGQSLTAKSTGGPEGRESFGARMLGRATSNAWRMLAPQIKPAPVKRQKPGRWHIVVGDTLREFQVPFVDLKNEVAPDSVARLVEWATGGKPVPDVVAMMEGGGAGRIPENPRSEPAPSAPPPDSVGITEYCQARGVDREWLRHQLDKRPEAPPVISRGAKSAKRYTWEALDMFVAQRLREPVASDE